MSDVQAQNGEEEVPQSNSMAAFSDRMGDLSDALDILYIPNNASGRNKFREQWADIADYIFGAELIQYDNEGCTDREHRKELEEAAIDKRLLLKATLQEIVDKSVDSGVLQMEYVGKVVDEFGACVCQCLYAENIIERVRPGLLAKAQDKKDTKTQEEQDKQDEADEAIRESVGSNVDTKVEENVVAPTEIVEPVQEAAEPSGESLDEEELERQRLADEKSILSNNVVEEKTEAPQAEEPAKPKLEIAGMPPIADDMFEDVMPIDTSSAASSKPLVDSSEQVDTIVEEKVEAPAAPVSVEQAAQADAPKGETSQEADPAAIAASLLGGDVKAEPVAEDVIQPEQEKAVEDAAAESHPAPPVDVETVEKTGDAEVEAQDAQEEPKPASGTYKSLFNSLAQAA